MTKKELRKIYRERRLQLTEKDRIKLDDLLLIQLQRLPLERVQTFMSFWPIFQQAEMNTHLFTRYLEFAIPNVTVTYPVMDEELKQMKAIQVDEDTAFEQNQWGIYEPAGGNIIDPQELDLIFVPLLVADKNGYRVGYGKGYYDRFLQQCRDDVIKAGFSYFPPIEHIEDTHQFDVPLNYCITPDTIYEF